MTLIRALEQLPATRFESPAILKKLVTASRKLAELKRVVGTIPNQAILINALGLQEAKDSSAIEAIVTTHDDIFKHDVYATGSPAAKEVHRYRHALLTGYKLVSRLGLLTNNHILEIQQALELNDAGFRKQAGIEVKNLATGELIYLPPQDPAQVAQFMSALENFINKPELSAVDPLIKMALIHHQFESIHPFYDGNGRSGRIINVLYLVKEGLLEIPVLYLSRYILRTKPEYYRLLQAVRDEDAWEEWVIYMLTAVEETAAQDIATIEAIGRALFKAKHEIRTRYKKFYSQDLINNLFTHPYTKIDYLKRDLKVSRLTATKYLDTLARDGFLIKEKHGRSNYYINHALMEILKGKAKFG